MSFASAGTLTVDRFSSSNVRQVVGTGSGYDGFVNAFGSDVVSYWKFENTGVDEKGTANASISGVPEFSIPSIVTPDRVGEGASSDGEVLAWPGTAGEYAQVAHTAAHKTLEATIVVHFQCDSLNDTSTLIAANATPAQPGELVILINQNGSPQANLRNTAGAPVVLAGVAGDVVVGRAYAIVVKHGAAGFSMALYNDAFQLVGGVRRTNPLATGQAASLSPIRFGAYHTDVDHHDGPYGRVVWLRRRITDAEELLLAKPRTVAHGTPPGGTYDDAPITSRNPKLYLPLEEVSGSPIDAAGAGYAGSLSVVGTPVAYGIETQKGRGIRLGTNAYIQATHHAVFETAGGDGPFGPSGSYGVNGIIESEATFSIHCAFPAALQNNWVLFSKDNDETSVSPGVSLRVHANGQVELRVREHKYRAEVRMRSPVGIVTQGSEHHFTVSLGYAGAWFTVDGRQVELGFKNNLAWWGLDHRASGIEEAGSTATSVRTRNQSAIRLGRTGDQSTSADIVVTKFAVFHSGTTRIAQTQITPGFTLAACQALAGASGAVLEDPRYGTSASPDATPAPGTNTLSTAMAAASPGQCIRINGSYTQSVNLVLKSGVRLFSTTGATITLTGTTTKVTTAFPTTMAAITGVADVAVGSNTISGAVPGSILNANQEAALLICENEPIGSLYGVPATNIENPASKRNDWIPIRTRTASGLTLARGTYFNHPTTGRNGNPLGVNLSYDIQVDGPITIQKNVAATPHTDPVVYIHGVRRCQFRNVTVLQQVATPSTGGGIIAFKFLGCVEVQTSGCTVNNSSNLFALDRLPYSHQYHGCAHYDVFDCDLIGAGWHGLDNEVRNFLAIWGLGGPATSLYGGQFGDCRNCFCDSGTNLFPAIMHDSIRITFFDLDYDHGGIDIAGWGHEIRTIVTQVSPSHTTELGFFRGAGGLYMWHCDFNDTIGKWGNGNWGLRRSNFGDCHYTGAPGNSGSTVVPHDASSANLFTDVSLANFANTANGPTFPF
jgi:hypothetical protein